jgi:hypothetical protein
MSLAFAQQRERLGKQVDGNIRKTVGKVKDTFDKETRFHQPECPHLQAFLRLPALRPGENGR